ALVLGPDLEIDEMRVVLARRREHPTAAGDGVLEPHDGGEAHAELADVAGAGPVGHALADEAHREHAVGEPVPHVVVVGELVVLVDRIEVTGVPSVARQLDLLDGTLDERRQLVAYLDVFGVHPRVSHSRTTVMCRIEPTISPILSVAT